MARKRTGRPPGRPPGTPAFARVERARQALAKEAEFYVRNHKTAATVAAKRGNSAPSEWALTHIAAVDDQGKEQRIVAPSVDRQQIDKASGVQIMIGGGWAATAQPPAIAVREVPQLPEAVIDTESE